MHVQPPIPSRTLAESFDALSAYLDAVKYVVHAVQDAPDDDELIQEALDALTSIRHGMEQGEMFMDLFRDVRDHLVAVLGHRTDLTQQVIGDAAGVNDSYVSRVTKRVMGSTRREHRRAKRAAQRARRRGDLPQGGGHTARHPETKAG